MNHRSSVRQKTEGVIQNEDEPRFSRWGLDCLQSKLLVRQPLTTQDLHALSGLDVSLH